MNKEIFGGFIAILRKEAGMTQKQVADRLHVTDRAVSKWERGLSYPDVTLMEPLAAVLGVGVDELLTCQRKKTAIPEPELPALRSVLTITQEEKRIRTRRTQALVWIAIAAALALTVLTTMQRNGKLLFEQRTTSPDGSTTFTAYRDRLLDGVLYMKTDHPISFEGAACPYCGRGTPNWTDRQELEWYLTSVESLSWSADGRYLLIQGGGSNGKSVELLLWDFMKYGKDSPVHSNGITLDILQQLSGYDVYQSYLNDTFPPSRSGAGADAARAAGGCFVSAGAVGIACAVRGSVCAKAGDAAFKSRFFAVFVWRGAFRAFDGCGVFSADTRHFARKRRGVF